jgi:chromate transporter
MPVFGLGGNDAGGCSLSASTDAATLNAEAASGLPSLGEAFWTWSRIALLSFGGPAGQIAVMHRILVVEKGWISETRFLHALNYCMLLPGPEAHQLAVYIGWLMHRTWGGIVSGTLFVLPGVVSLGILSALYAAYGQLGLVAAIFFGLKAAVLAIVLEAVVRIGRRALRSPAHVAIAALAFVGIFAFGIPFPLIILTAGLIGYLGQHFGSRWFEAGSAHGPGKSGADRPGLIDLALAHHTPDHLRPTWARFTKVMVFGGLIWFAPLILLLLMRQQANVFTTIAIFNSKMAVVTFGGAYAVLAYMAQQAVEFYHWLKPGEMLVGLGFAETTPGPLISVVQFVGFMAAYRHAAILTPMLAGTLGGLLAMWSTFVPSFLWIFLGGPYVEALIGNKALSAALSAITGAVVGVILNLAVWFALHSLFGQLTDVRTFGLSLSVPVWSTLNVAALVIMLAAMVAIFRFKIGMIPVLLGSCFAGIGVFFITNAL